MSDDNTIYFYGRTNEFGNFSNFSHHGFELDGKFWRTSEHYFQAMKFKGTKHVEEIRKLAKPNLAARKGRDRKLPLRKDWESVKDDVMRRAVLAKFRAHEELREELLGTGDAHLVENAPGDYYWGCGANGTGKNMLGKILVETRAILRKEAEEG